MKKITLSLLLLLTTQLIISQTITTYSTGFTSLEGIAVNSNNEVFVSEHDSGKVYSIDASGVAAEYASTGGFYANNIVFNANDDLFITEPYLDKIYIKNSTAAATVYVDISDNPNSLAFDSNGNLLYSTTSKIVKIDSSLALTDYVSPFYYAEGIAFDSTGNLYIVDRSDRKLYKYDTSNVLTVVASNIEGIRGVAVATDDTVYFTMSKSYPETYKILKYDPSTNTVTDYVTTNLDKPRHLAIDAIGNMYVTNLGNNTVVKIHDLSLSISNEIVSTFNVYPNPTNASLHIESVYTIVSAHVYNELGQLVSTSFDTETIDLSSLRKGVYFVKIIDNQNHFETLKVVRN